MKFKELGNSGEKISAITLGSWGIGGAGWDTADRRTSEKAIERMLDCGVNSIDTAPIYGFPSKEEDFGYGYAERVIAPVIKNRRSDVFLMTKCGLNFDREQGPRSMYESMTKDEIISGCEGSLKRLGTDYIDLLYVHWPDNITPLEEVAEAMQQLIAAGKIRYYGLSNFSLENTFKLDEMLHVTAVEQPYSMVDRSQEDLLQELNKRGIGTATYGSLGSGILTGAYRTIPELSSTDMRSSFYHFFEEPIFGQIQKLLIVMDEISANHNASVSQVAIQWVTNKNFVDTAILGVSKPKHAEQNCASFDWALSEEEMKQLDNAVEEYVGKGVGITP